MTATNGMAAEIAAEVVALIERQPQVERRALSIAEAAESLGVSTDYFTEHIAPDLRIARRGRRKLIPVRELDRWLDESSGSSMSESLRPQARLDD